jgi:ABC-type Fe3+ transport system substrate-binding protein
MWWRTAPQSWLDLAKPEYNGQFALSGDPRTSNQAILSIQAASLANGGTLADPTAGLELMAQVNQAGNLVPVIALPGTVALGETPITAVWDYNALAWADGFEGNPPPRSSFRPTVASPASICRHQRLCAAPECSQAVDGIPLLRRRPTHVDEGLLPPDPRG